MAETTESEFAGCRVLVVEDSFLIATALSDMLTKLGCEVVGPASTVADARGLIADRQPHLAVLDIALHHEDSTPIARELAAHDRPFTFLTGYDGARVLPEDLRSRPCLQKPIEFEMLRRTLRGLRRSSGCG